MDTLYSNLVHFKQMINEMTRNKDTQQKDLVIKQKEYDDLLK